MDSLGITLQDLLGPVAYTEWFGNESSRTSTAFEDEMVRGGASGSSAETTRGGADTAASSSLGDNVDELLMLANQQFEKQKLTKRERALQLSTEKLQFWITRFVLEKRWHGVPTKHPLPHRLWSDALPLLKW